MSSNKTMVEKLNEGKQLRAQLVEKNNRMSVDASAARRQLTEAEHEAKIDFQTSDLDELRALYRERENQNVAIVDVFYEAMLDAKRQLTEAEQGVNS